jgi:anti-sigma factor RsiW
MSVRENCDKTLLIQAEFDGELDAAQSVAIAGHRQNCTYCHDAWQRLHQAQQAMRSAASYHPASAALKRRLDEQLVMAGFAPARDVVQSGSSSSLLAKWWRSFIGFGLGAAIAASVAILFIQPAQVNDMTDLVLASHIRSLQPGHLLDIASNNQHNVKPWFDGKLDFAPPVKNLAAQGYPLEGGRLDYLQDREIAALVYQAGMHQINLLIWPALGNESTMPQLIEKGGFNISHWRQNDMMVWAISDLTAAELQKFVAIWRAQN